MNALKLALKDKRVHLYAWMAVVPRTFLTLVVIFYVWDAGVTSFMDAAKAVFGNKVLVIFLLLFGVLDGYVEGWCVQRSWKKRNDSGRVLPLR